MKLGLFLMPLHRPDRLHADTYQEDLDLIEYTDGLGYAETWVGEHFTLPWENMPSPELFIARCLGVTKQMKFGTGVSLLHYHNPAHVAHRIAMLDHMARGRIFMGIGSGGAPSDTEMFNVDLDSGSLKERMQESVELILKYWEGKPFEYKGRFFQTKVSESTPDLITGFHMKPYQDPHPPIAVAGSSPYSGTLEMVGEQGWLPLSSCFLHDSYLPTHWDVVQKGAAKGNKQVSRDEWRISREIFVADDGDKARDDVLNGPIGKFWVDYWIPLLGQNPRGLGSLKHDPQLPDDVLTPEYMLENVWIVGDPEECAYKISKLHDDVGGFGTLLLLCHDWEKDRQKWLRSLELMATKVLPEVNSRIS